MAGLIVPDVSEYQTPVTDAYKRDWLIYRALFGASKVDNHFGQNFAWTKQSNLTGQVQYGVYLPGNDILGAWKRLVPNPPANMAVMVDVEKWRGQSYQINGNHSPEINALVAGLAGWLGSRQRVLGYGGVYDLAEIWPNRPAWLRMIVPKYSSTPPTGVANMIGWQYTDGETKWPVPAGYTRSSAPFGNCDHNVFPGLSSADLAEALGIEAPLTPDDKTWIQAQLAKVPDAVWNSPRTDKDGVKRQAEAWLIQARNMHTDTQTAIAAVQTALGKVTAGAVDVAAVAAGVAALVVPQVVAKMKALNWKAS